VKDLAKKLDTLIERKQLLVRTDKKVRMGGTLYRMKLQDDRFVHFTPEERAEQILVAGKLLMHPPYEKFGIDVVAGVSLVYGQNVPTVQVSHSKGKVVAISFRTPTKPKYGFVEEVIWVRDVILKDARIISKQQAMAKLARSPYELGSQDMVEYK